MKKILLILFAQLCCVLYCNAQNDTIYDNSDGGVLWVTEGRFYLSIDNHDVCPDKKLVVFLGETTDEVETTLSCLRNYDAEYDDGDIEELRNRLAFLCSCGMECIGMLRTDEVLKRASGIWIGFDFDEAIMALEELSDVK